MATIILAILFILLNSSTKAITINPSCSQTPYPSLCDSMIRTAEASGGSSFRELAIGATLARVRATQSTASQAYTSSFDEPTKAAWADCTELFNNTIERLNRSLSPHCSRDDAQTWLSAAFANLETCRNGFSDLNSTYPFHFCPFLSRNISHAVSNLLAIHKPADGPPRKLLSEGNGFPAWVSGSDRRLLQSKSVEPDLVVAKDGSGHYATISEAVSAAASGKRRSTASRFVIYVKVGTYDEQVVIKPSIKNLMMIGDGIDRTVVTGSKSVAGGTTTFRSATFAVTGDGFMARDMTFVNSAGPEKHQAVAFRSGSDLSVLYRCSFKGYQDTLYAHSQRQFYRNCHIYGTVDFIFGDAAAVFQDSNIYIRKPLPGQKNTVTAQGRTDPNENTGISIHSCAISADDELAAVQTSFKSYLGRPWKPYSRTVIMNTAIGGLVDPAGWLPWNGSFALSTLYYGEYMNSGPSSATSARVNWPGFHVITNAAEAQKFTVASFISGDNWLPATGVPYTPGL